ncbi:MAG: EF-hand domain-containing protein [Cyclobacteriaceae bacterium]
MFSEFQRKKHTYFFSLLDLNRNGLLQFNDFSDMTEQVRVRFGLDEGGKEHKNIADKATRLFHQLLSDISPSESQSINQDEWIAFFENRLGGKFNEDALTEYQELIFRYVFDFFDHNHDGFITKDEYKIFFEIFGADATFFEKSFNQLDHNADGKISRYEMMAAIEDFLISDDPKAPGNWAFGNWESDPA